MIIPKTTAYVGETIPAEIRLGVSTRVPHRLIEGATLSGQGFTAQRMPNPAQTMESVNGRSYEVVTFKTAITAVRTGKLEIAAKDALLVEDARSIAKFAEAANVTTVTAEVQQALVTAIREVAQERMS